MKDQTFEELRLERLRALQSGTRVKHAPKPKKPAREVTRKILTNPETGEQLNMETISPRRLGEIVYDLAVTQELNTQVLRQQAAAVETLLRAVVCPHEVWELTVQNGVAFNRCKGCGVPAAIPAKEGGEE
jgi:hypothetical protein